MKTDAVAFYCQGESDSRGRTWEDLLAMSDRELESHHDIIQWMFPLHETSRFNPHCPIVDADSAGRIRDNPVAIERLRQMLIRFSRFLGFQHAEDGQFVRDPGLTSNRSNWQSPGNHNLLRITRVIRSLRLFGLEQESLAFFRAVHDSAIESHCVGNQTLRYWQLALNDPPFETLRK